MIYTDQCGRKLELTKPVLRIVSLVPSQSEFLYDLGVSERIVGVTKFCVHPQGFKNTITQVGGTKNVNFDKIEALAPDLIIANKEENTKDIVTTCETIAPTYVSDMQSLDDVYEMMLQLGDMLEVPALSLVDRIKKSMSFIDRPAVPLRVAYLIWKNPYMVAGGDTFINTMLEAAGFINAYADRSRYPEVDFNKFQNDAIDLVFLSSEPYPFKSDDVSAFAKANKKAVLVDGEIFSWYGTRLLKAADYFKQLKKQLS